MGQEMKTRNGILLFTAGCLIGIIVAVVGMVVIPGTAATPLTVSQHSQGKFVVAAHRDDGPVRILVSNDQSFVLPDECVYVGISPDGSVIIEENQQLYRLTAISNEAERVALPAEPDGTKTLMNTRIPRELR